MVGKEEWATIAANRAEEADTWRRSYEEQYARARRYLIDAERARNAALAWSLLAISLAMVVIVMAVQR